MFGKIKFNVASPYNEEMTRNNASVLKRWGFTIFDISEADVLNSNDEKIGKVYILCCKGNKRDYEIFKNKLSYKEILYEGRKTLVG